MIDLAGLSTQERDTLIALLSEANNRGLRIELGDLSNKPAASWPMKNGYFLRMDGAEYNPTYSQAAFITSNAIYTGFWGSRGSGKSSAGSQKASKKIRDGQNGIIANPDFENLTRLGGQGTGVNGSWLRCSYNNINMLHVGWIKKSGAIVYPKKSS